MLHEARGRRGEINSHKYWCVLITKPLSEHQTNSSCYLCEPRLHRAQGQNMRAEQNLRAGLQSAVRMQSVVLLVLNCLIESEGSSNHIQKDAAWFDPQVNEKDDGTHQEEALWSFIEWRFKFTKVCTALGMQRIQNLPKCVHDLEDSEERKQGCPLKHII